MKKVQFKDPVLYLLGSSCGSSPSHQDLILPLRDFLLYEVLHDIKTNMHETNLSIPKMLVGYVNKSKYPLAKEEYFMNLSVRVQKTISKIYTNKSIDS